MIPLTHEQIIADQYHRIEELERRFELRERTGKIVEVDETKMLARVEFGKDPKTEEPFLSPWVPWKEVGMGAIRTHFPPAVGEQVKLVSESGDLTDAVIDMSLESDTFQRPHDKLDEGVIQIGSSRIPIKDGETRLTGNKIVTDGNTHPGGEGGQLVHRKGNLYSDGDTAVESAS